MSLPNSDALLREPVISDSSGGWLSFDKVIFTCIGLVLIVTAISKSWVLLTDPFVELKTGYPLLLIASAIILELGLLYILVTQDFAVRVAATLILFSAFLSVSVYHIISGKQSCGCLGVFEVSPIITAMLSLLIISSMICVCVQKSKGIGELFRSLGSISSPSAGSQTFIRFAGLAFCLMALTAISEIGWVKSRVATLMDGEKTVAAMPINLGDVSTDPEVINTEVVLSNSGSQVATIVGSTQSCSCTSVQIAGKIVPPMGSVRIPVTFTKNRNTVFHHRVRFFLNHPDQFSVDADIIGRWKSPSLKE